MEVRYFREYLDISLTPAMKLEYYNLMRDRYNAVLSPQILQIPLPPPLPKLDSGSEERKTVVMNIFSKMRRAQFGR